jgi:hypothetical protein
MSEKDLDRPTSELIAARRAELHKAECILWALFGLTIWLAGLVTGISIATG